MLKGGKKCSTVIDDGTKQKVRSRHSSVFLSFSFFYPDIYIMMIMKVAEKTEAALPKLFKQHGHA